jgi:DNA mismatch repair protein MutS
MTDVDRREVQIASGAPAAPGAVKFHSLLTAIGDPAEAAHDPPFFRALNLDQVVDAIVGRRDEYRLRPFFRAPLRDAGDVRYRHDAFRDFELEPLRTAVAEFADQMRTVHAYLGLAERQRYPLEQQRWLLDAAALYCRRIWTFAHELEAMKLSSAALRGLRDHLAGYVISETFRTLETESQSVLDGLARIRYSVHIKGDRVTVQAYEGEDDYTVEVAETFGRFRERGSQRHLVGVTDPNAMDGVEAQIAESVSRLFPQELAALSMFCNQHRDFLDPVVVRCERELQFYVAYLRHVERLQPLDFTLPDIVNDWGGADVAQGFDIALAGRGASGIVRNDFALQGRERIIVVTGPNQGGKTTFARMVGQLHYLAALGVPVPARTARLVLCDQLLTLFGKEEDITTLRGRLDDELVRLKEILDTATPRSLVLLNEVFSSTTVEDAVYLGTEIIEQLVARGCAAVWVTFVDELASLGDAIVSMVAGVDPDDPSRRTFEIERRAPDGLAYAWALAEKYGLSADALRRIAG